MIEDYDSSESAAVTRHRQPPLQELPSAPAVTPGGSRTPIPKLNLGELATLSPPPTDVECALHALAVGGSGLRGAGTGVHSARSGQPSTASASSVSASRNNSISFYHAQPVPVPAVIGAVTTPRTSRSDTNNPMGTLASTSFEATPTNGPAIAVGVDDPLDSQQQEASDVRQEVLRAAAQTAVALQSNRDDFEARRLVVRNCQKLNEAHLRKLLTFDPRLAMARTTEMGNLAVDGQTPLHVAASFGNTAALHIMVEKGEGVSLWVRDLQGRTPLHVAAEKGQLETCEYLRQAMCAERQRDPIGEHAPVDLAVILRTRSLTTVCYLALSNASLMPGHHSARLGNHRLQGQAKEGGHDKGTVQPGGSQHSAAHARYDLVCGVMQPSSPQPLRVPQ